MFQIPQYNKPDFTQACFSNAPDVKIGISEKDGVAPDYYHSTSMFPEYFKINGKWTLAIESRMDSLIVLMPDGTLDVRECRRIKKGEKVILGRSENCEEGIFLHTDSFSPVDGLTDRFVFRTGRSRETAFSSDYDRLYELLKYDKEHGFIVWVMGPAVAFDCDSRNSMQKLIQNGFVDGLLAGNALATHDLEAGNMKTALGQDIYTQKSMPNGHYNHLDVINKIRRAGSIKAFIENGEVKDGIIYSCVKHDVPFVLTGSIRDDGPLPEVYADVYKGQDAMRELIKKATTVICIATQLHTIASGNMTPSFRMVNGELRPLFIYSIDISEFAVNKLRDRGSLSATSIVTNAQDFIVNVARGVNV